MTNDAPPLRAPDRVPLSRRPWLLGLGASLALHGVVLASIAAKAPPHSAPSHSVEDPGATLAWVEVTSAEGQSGPDGEARTGGFADALGVPVPQGTGEGSALRQPAASRRRAMPPVPALAEHDSTASAPPAREARGAMPPAGALTRRDSTAQIPPPINLGRNARPPIAGLRAEAHADAVEPSRSDLPGDVTGPEEASRALATASGPTASNAAVARESHLDPEEADALAAGPSNGSAAPAASAPAQGEGRSGATGSTAAPGHAGSRNGLGAAGGTSGRGGPAGTTRTVPQALVDQLRLAAQRCYPPVAQRFRLRGEVVVGFCAGSQGRAEAVRIVESSGKASLDAAVDCVLREAGALAVDDGCFVLPVAFGTAG